MGCWLPEHALNFRHYIHRESSSTSDLDPLEGLEVPLPEVESHHDLPLFLAQLGDPPDVGALVRTHGHLVEGHVREGPDHGRRGHVQAVLPPRFAGDPGLARAGSR